MGAVISRSGKVPSRSEWLGRKRGSCSFSNGLRMVDQVVGALLEKRFVEAHGAGQQGKDLPVGPAFPDRRDRGPCALDAVGAVGAVEVALLQ